MDTDSCLEQANANIAQLLRRFENIIALAPVVSLFSSSHLLSRLTAG